MLKIRNLIKDIMNRIELTDEKFQEIYTNKKFRNEVANAHECLDQFHNFKYFATCSYPISYIVTEDQINASKKEKQRARLEAIKDVGNKLVFIGMGVNFEPKNDDDISNHRFRTELKSPAGRTFFIEFSLSTGDHELIVNYSIDRDLEESYKNRNVREQPYYNYGRIEHNRIARSKKAILNIVNNTYGCHFKEMEIDEYDLWCGDFVCISPSK